MAATDEPASSQSKRLFDNLKTPVSPKKAKLDHLVKLRSQVEVAVATFVTSDPSRKWLYGEIVSWVPCQSDDPGPGEATTEVHYCVGNNPIITPAELNTEEVASVTQNLKFNQSKKIWELKKEKIWPHSFQRKLEEAFVDGFLNSAGRNALHSLLEYLVDKDLDVFNVGGRNIRNRHLNAMRIVYQEYISDIETSGTSSTESSLAKELYISQDDGSQSIVRVPVLDVLVKLNRQPILIVSIKNGRIRPEHREQLRHEMMSLLPDGGDKIGGLVICQFSAEFYLVVKETKQISIFQLDAHRFVEKGKDIASVFSTCVKYMIGLINYVKA